MSKEFLSLTRELHDYLVDVSVRESDLLKRLRAETAELPENRMQICPEQGQLMALLVRLMGVRRALEVGVFTGYSSTCVATALPAGGKLTACDISPEWTKIARRYWDEAGVAGKIELHLAPATETLGGLIRAGHSGSYDFAFIDADKTQYAAYYELALELVRPGGLILFDNTLWHGRVIDPSVIDADTLAIRELNRSLLEDDRIDLSLLPIGDGLTLARRRAVDSSGLTG